MGQSIWHELDIPGYPLSDEEKAIIHTWTAVGKGELLDDPSQPDVALLSGIVLLERTNKLPNSLPRFIGFSLGIRAGREHKSLVMADDNAFEFPSLGKVRQLKVLGQNAAELNPASDFITVVNQAIEVSKGNTNSRLQVAEDFMAYGMGFREVRAKQGVAV
jgi:hypothetical protein